jgi:hypothetical protein
MKETVKVIIKKALNWEKVLVNHVINKRLFSRLCKEPFLYIQQGKKQAKSTQTNKKHLENGLKFA